MSSPSTDFHSRRSGLSAVPDASSDAQQGTIVYCDFDLWNIGLSALVILVGLIILVLRKHSFISTIVLFPVIGGLITTVGIHSVSAESGLITMLLSTVGFGLLVPVASFPLFRFMPCAGPACILALLLLIGGLVTDCAGSLSMTLLLEVAAPLTAVVITLGVYSVAGVPLFRDSLFDWPQSRALNLFHILLSTFAASFCLTTSPMYLIHSHHENLISMSSSSIASRACDSSTASIGLAVWLAMWLLFAFSRTKLFDQMAGWVWRKIRCPWRKNQRIDTVSLISNRAGGDPEPVQFGSEKEWTDRRLSASSCIHANTALPGS